MKTAGLMLAATALVAVAMLAVLRLFDGADAFPTSAASLPPRNDGTVPSAAASASGADIALTMDGVGGLAFGTPMDDAVEQLTGWLGAPDEGPTDFFCEMEGPKVGELYAWKALIVMSKDGELHGWGVGTEDAEPPTGVRSDVGVGLGATVADLQQAFGAQLDLFTQERPGEPPQPSFVVGATEDPQGRPLAGWLTGLEPADTTTALNVGSPCRS
jgi:hypothetical protein